MNIVNYFLLFIVTLAIIVFAIVNVWNTRLSENKGLNVFIIVFIVITVLSFLGIGLSRNLQSHTENIMPVVGETGVRGTRGDQGESAKSCNCNDDTYYKKVMEHITLVYNEWNRVNGFPIISTKKYIKNKYLKNKINMICNSKIFGDLVKQNGISKCPYINFKKGILEDKIEMCDIKSNCGAFDLLLEACRKWILIILKYDKGKYFLDSEELTDRDFDTLITELDLDQSSLPGYETGKVEWVFLNPIIFPNYGVDHKKNYDAIRKKYVSKDDNNNEIFNDDAFEKDNITLYDLSDNVKFKQIDAAKRAEFYRSDFYKFYSVPGIVNVDGENSHSPFDEIKMFDIWYWGSNEETRPKLLESCDTIYDDPQRKYNNITWDLIDLDTGNSIKPLPGSGLNDQEISEWGTSNFDNFSPRMKSVTVQSGKKYSLVSGNSFDTNERWYGGKLEIKDGGSSSLLKLNYIDNEPITFKNNKIRIRFKPDFEFYDEDTPKIKVKISNDYDEVWNNLNKRQIKLVTPENISGTSMCKYKNVYIPYRNKGNTINNNGYIDDNNRKINFFRAKDFSDKDEKELKYKYYKPLGDVFNVDINENKKQGNNECRPFIDSNVKEPADFKNNGPKTPSILVSGDVVRPKSYKRKFIRKRHEGAHKNDFSYSFWEPEAPDGYVCLGEVVSSSITGKPPSLDAVRCLPSKCVEELTPEKIKELNINSIHNVVKPKWTTRDYKIDPSDSRFNDYLKNKDPEAHNALKGDGWRCGISPSLNGFVGDTDYYYNIDDLDNPESTEYASNNNKHVELFVNDNVPNIQNINKDYDFSVDSENLLLKYNIFKSRGTTQTDDDLVKYILKTSTMVLTLNNITNQITLETKMLESPNNEYYNSLYFKPSSVENKILIYFETRTADENVKLKKYITGDVDPRITINEDEATKYIKESHSGGTIKLLGDINGNSKYMAMSEIIIARRDRSNIGDGIPIALRLENRPSQRNPYGVSSRIFTIIKGKRYYLYENTAQEIKFTSNRYEGSILYLNFFYMNRGRKRVAIFVNNRYIKVDDNKLKTSNVIQHKDLDLYREFEGSLYNKFTIENIGYKIKLKDKFFFDKFTKASQETETLPKFYKIKNQCIYDPKEYKYKKPNISVGEKYGKDYSVLKIYD